MSKGTVRLTVEGNIAAVLFDRPQARNAMTWAMYEQLGGICTQLQSEAAIRAVRFKQGWLFPMCPAPSARVRSHE